MNASLMVLICSNLSVPIIVRIVVIVIIVVIVMIMVASLMVATKLF